MLFYLPKLRYDNDTLQIVSNIEERGLGRSAMQGGIQGNRAVGPRAAKYTRAEASARRRRLTTGACPSGPLFAPPPLPGDAWEPQRGENERKAHGGKGRAR